MSEKVWRTVTNKGIEDRPAWLDRAMPEKGMPHPGTYDPVAQRSRFDISLTDAQVYENVLVDILRLQGALIEVKHDKGYVNTGNVFVEFESRGKPSGIAVTGSQWWAFWLNDGLCMIVPFAKLHRLCKEHYEMSGWVRGGDDLTSKGVLLPVAKLLEA